MAANDDLAIRIDGLKELRGALRNTDKEALKALQGELKNAAGIVATEASILAPMVTGRLASSIRPYTSGNKFGVRSNLPYAPVVHWGGTIRPRGVPIVFRPQPFILEAIDRTSEEVAEQVAAVLDAAITRAGWH